MNPFGRIAAPAAYRLAMTAIVSALAAWYAGFLVFGTPLNLNHDELNFLYEALRLPAQGRLTGYIHGSLLYEIIAACEVVLYGVLRVVHAVASPFEFLVRVLIHLEDHLRLCRAIVAIAGVGTVIQVFRVGALFGDRLIGVMAALLCATNYTFIAMTSVCKEDVLSWLFVLLAMEFAWRAGASRSLRLASVAGICIGAATAAKFLGVFAGALALVPLLQKPAAPRRDAARIAATIAATAAASFLLLFPFLLTDTAAVFASVRYLEAAMAGMSDQLALRGYLLFHLRNITGSVVLVAGAIDLIRRCIVDPRGPAMLIVVPILQLLFLGMKKGYSIAHYAVPLAIFFFILASSLALQIFQRVRARGVAVVFAVAVALLDPAYASSSAKYAMLLTGPDTRLLVRDRFAAMARPGDCVVINQAIRGENVLGPPLNTVHSAGGSGTFTSAAHAAAARAPEPHYDVRLIPGGDVVGPATDGCRWAIAGRFSSRMSGIEYDGKTRVRALADPRVPPGFALAARIDAFPELHSVWYPYPTTLDYDDLRGVSFRDMKARRKLGLTFFIYERGTGSGIAGSSVHTRIDRP